MNILLHYKLKELEDGSEVIGEVFKNKIHPTGDPVFTRIHRRINGNAYGVQFFEEQFSEEELEKAVNNYKLDDPGHS